MHSHGCCQLFFCFSAPVQFWPSVEKFSYTAKPTVQVPGTWYLVLGGDYGEMVLYAFGAAHTGNSLSLNSFLLLGATLRTVTFISIVTIRKMKISLALLFASIVATSAQDNLKERLLEHRVDQFQNQRQDKNVRCEGMLP